MATICLKAFECKIFLFFFLASNGMKVSLVMSHIVYELIHVLFLQLDLLLNKYESLVAMRVQAVFSVY